MSDTTPATGFDVFQDAEVMKVIGHPLRMRAFTEAVKGPVSAKELSQRLNEPLPKMSYHVRALADAGLIKSVRRTRRRGAIETHYRAIATLDVSHRVLANAPPDVLSSFMTTQMRLIAEDALHALERDASTERDLFLSRAHFVVDAEGREKLAAELRAMYVRLAELEKELRVEPGEDAVGLNVGLMFYAGEREAGRNGPMLLSFDEDDVIETIPPD